jgi:hypothetical protein
MPKFEVGNLVRVQATGDADAGRHIMRVLGTEGFNVHCAIGNDDEDEYFFEDVLELVADNIDEHVAVPQKLNGNTVDSNTIHKQLNGYIIALIQELRDEDVNCEIDIHIRCSNYSGDNAMIKYGIELGYDREVVSDNLSKSAHVALARRRENESLEVKALPMYVDDVA